MKIQIVLMLVTAFVLAGATAQSGRGNSDPTALSAKPEASLDSLPESPANRQFRWLAIELMRESLSVTEADTKAHFCAEFLTRQRHQDLLRTLNDVAVLLKGGTFRGADRPTPDDTSVGHFRGSDSTLYRLIVSIEPESGLIRHFLLSKEPYPDAAAVTTWDSAASLLGQLGSGATLYAARLGFAANATAELLAGASFQADNAINIASLHKLYVLGELTRQVEAGDTKWDEVMFMQERFRSPGSGTLASLTPGTRLTVREWAHAMIHDSDNTATDHLLSLLGPDRVLASVGRMGHARPSLSEPFLSTREATALTLTADASLQDQWKTTDAAGRRALLPRVKALDPWTLKARDDPGPVDTVGWFGSARDVGQAMLSLTSVLEPGRKSPVPAMLTVPDTLAFLMPDALGTKPNPWVGVKTGHATGIRAVAFLIRMESEWRVWVLAVNDTRRDPDTHTWNKLVAGCLKLVMRADGGIGSSK